MNVGRITARAIIHGFVARSDLANLFLVTAKVRDELGRLAVALFPVQERESQRDSEDR